MTKSEIKKLSLIKEAANKSEPSSGKEVVKLLNSQLKGKNVNAFGGKSGLWGADKKTHTYKISSVKSGYNDGNFVSVDVVLTGYNESNPLIYTDPIFLKSIRNLVKSVPAGKYIKSIDYSEYGMQGKSYVNLDVTLKNLIQESAVKTKAVGDRLKVKANKVLGTPAAMGTIRKVKTNHYIVHIDGDDLKWDGPVSFDGEILNK